MIASFPKYLLSLWRWLSWSKPAGALRQAQGAGGLSGYELLSIVLGRLACLVVNEAGERG